jgi:hypothetical protein
MDYDAKTLSKYNLVQDTKIKWIHEIEGSLCQYIFHAAEDEA